MIQLLLRQVPSPPSLAVQNTDFTAEASRPAAQPSDAGARAGFMSQLALAALLASPLIAHAADRVAVQGPGDGWTQNAVANPGGPELGLPTRPVPEPGTYVLMLAGLAVLALLARRHSPE